MRKNYCRLFLLLFLVLGTISCKKSILDVNGEKGISTSEISAAKEWYETQLKTSKTGAKTNIGFLKKQIAWEQLVNIQKDNITLVPFSISDAKNNKVYLELLKNEKGEILSAKYVFLLSNEFVENTKAHNMIISKQNIENFSGAIIEYDLNNSLLSSYTYKNGNVDNSIYSNLEIKNNEDATQNRSIDEECESQSMVCTDWYWVTTEHNTGVVVSEVYLYTTCSCGGVIYSSGGVDIQPGVARTRIQSYEVFRRVNYPGSPENWYMVATCTTSGLIFTNTQNNTFSTITNPGSAVLSITNPAYGGPFLPIYPPSNYYCIWGNVTYNLGLSGNQRAVMTTTSTLSYNQQLPPRFEAIQRGHTWFAPNDLF